MFTSSLLFNEPIVNFCDRLVEGNRAAGVEASGDVCGIFVGASAAKAFVFIFSVDEREHAICGAEVGDLFGDKYRADTI